MMNDIIWLPIPGYEGIYEASNQGDIRSVDHITDQGQISRGRVLKQIKTYHGYLQVAMCKNGKPKTVRVHRQILAAFVGLSDSPVNHKDGDKTNNQLSNLEYVTPTQNIQHAIAMGLMDNRGENGVSFLTNSQMIEIKELLKNSSLSQKRIAEMFGMAQPSVSQINTGKRWQWLGDYTYPIREIVNAVTVTTAKAA